LLVSVLFYYLRFQLSLNAQEGDPANGKSLFNANCAACHKLNKPMTGPALANVEQRLYDEEGLDREWINKWIRNSSSLIKSGDPYAVKIFNEWNKVAMNAFPQLSDQDISDILAYTAAPPPAPPLIQRQTNK
jgi:mono/diheme cytochrome c family protein